MGIKNRIKNAWDAFTSRDPTWIPSNYGPADYDRPDRPVLKRGNDRTIVNSIYNRMAVDVAATRIVHAKIDENDRFIETVDSNLNECLTVEANIDQTGRQFIQDICMSMFDEGYIAIVPVVTTINPDKSESFGRDIDVMRRGQILEWHPKHIKVRVYNQNTGKKEDLILSKETVAIVENPLYAIMNSPNSTLQRLIHKLALLDKMDNDTASDKLNLIIQLPYVVKTKLRKEQATERVEAIENQLAKGKHGIAYADATEKITQLNRPIENNLLSQIEYLTKQLYGQLGITQEIMEGTADEKTMLNYYNRTIEPILAALTDEMKRKFLSKTARTQKQTILFFRDPFRLVPINDIAEIADKFTRNEIMTANEIRQVVGMRPSNNPNADDLRNRNIIATEYGNVYDGNPNVEEGVVEEEETY